MRLIEYEAKQLLKEAGLSIPTGQLVTTPEEAEAAARQMADVVLKAQVPLGKRLKAGGIRFLERQVGATIAAQSLFGLDIGGFKAPCLLLEEKISIKREFFLSFTYDTAQKRPLILAAKAGGIEIETEPNIITRHFSSLQPPAPYLGREIAAEMGCEGKALLALGDIITRLAALFLAWDALLLEINPLVQTTEGQFVLVDAHIELDDDARQRQATLFAKCRRSATFAKKRTEFERLAAEIDGADHRGVAGRLVPFEGNLGLLIGGGGASLTIFDAVLQAGGNPANYCEIGGNPSVWKVKELTKLILSQPQVEYLAVLMNVVSNTRVDLVARGVIKGVLEVGLNPAQVIVAFRIPGSWEEEGAKILNRYGVAWFGREMGLDEVVRQVVATLKH